MICSHDSCNLWLARVITWFRFYNQCQMKITLNLETLSFTKQSTYSAIVQNCWNFCKFELTFSEFIIRWFPSVETQYHYVTEKSSSTVLRNEILLPPFRPKFTGILFTDSLILFVSSENTCRWYIKTILHSWWCSEFSSPAYFMMYKHCSEKLHFDHS